MTIRSRRPALLASVVAAPLALALVACGSSDDTQNASSPTDPGSETSSSPAQASTPSSDTDAGSPAAPADQGSTDAAALAAARTGTAAVEGSTVFSVDREAGGWEVSVVTGDGTESDLAVSEDGRTVTREPVVDADDTDDADDVAERQRLLQEAQLDQAAAVAAARAEVSGGSVTGFDLDVENGVATWDVQLDEDTAEEQTVTIDAVTGGVLRVEQDD